MNKYVIDKDEVLRYLGYKGQEIDNSINTLIDECREETEKLINPRWIYKIHEIEINEDGVNVNNTNLVLKGNDIKNHLSKSNKTALMAVTLGIEIEKKIKLYEKISLTKALVMDACATTVVEEICDNVEEEIRQIAKGEGRGLTFRYSPGYGDLPIETQKAFIKAVRAESEIGLSASAHNILFPRKSVTAIIGFIPEDIKVKKRSCETCSNYERCNFRKEGISCAN